MDIHKPKPWHGVREFLKEYLIIVVGVLTALGAEQVATGLHERKIADEARESVRAEVRENLWWLERRERREPCARQTLAEIADVLDSARHGRPYPVPRDIGQVYHAKLTSLRWEANAQAGRASLFTPQAISYRRRLGIPAGQIAMAVLVQRLVVAEAAGVMLTIDQRTANMANPAFSPTLSRT